MRQISGEVYAAAQASTCCDVTGEESPKERRGEIKITPETNSLFEASPSTTQPLIECCLFSYNSETTGDGAKMFNSDEYVPS